MRLEILAVLTSTFDNLNCYEGKDKKGKEILFLFYLRHLSVYFLHGALVVESSKGLRAANEIESSNPGIDHLTAGKKSFSTLSRKSGVFSGFLYTTGKVDRIG